MNKTVLRSFLVAVIVLGLVPGAASAKWSLLERISDTLARPKAGVRCGLPLLPGIAQGIDEKGDDRDERPPAYRVKGELVYTTPTEPIPISISVDTDGAIAVSIGAEVRTGYGTVGGHLVLEENPYLGIHCGTESRYYDLKGSGPFVVRLNGVEGTVEFHGDGHGRIDVHLNCRDGTQDSFQP